MAKKKGKHHQHGNKAYGAARNAGPSGPPTLSKQQERRMKAQLRKQRHQELYDDSEMADFRKQLQTQGLVLRDITGDGNCFFRAVCDQLEGNERHHREVRAEVAAFIEMNREDFAPFVEDDMSFEAHLRELRKPGEYVGNDAVVAFARMRNLAIIIHRLGQPRWVVCGSDAGIDHVNGHIHLAYHEWEHYSSVRAQDDPDPLGPAFSAGYKVPQTFAPKAFVPVEAEADSKKTSGKRKSATKDEKKLASSAPASSSATASASSAPSSSTSPPSTLSPEAEQVMAATGCSDVQQVVETLEGCGYSVDAAISELLQVMCLMEDTAGPSAPSHPSASSPLAPSADASDESPAAASAAAASPPSPPTPASPASPPSASAQRTPPAERKAADRENTRKETAHAKPLSNSQRKAKAKLDKKKRREEERRRALHNNSADGGHPNALAAAAGAADVGSLAI